MQMSSFSPYVKNINNWSDIHYEQLALNLNYTFATFSLEYSKPNRPTSSSPPISRASGAPAPPVLLPFPAQPFVRLGKISHLFSCFFLSFCLKRWRLDHGDFLNPGGHTSAPAHSVVVSASSHPDQLPHVPDQFFPYTSIFRWSLEPRPSWIDPAPLGIPICPGLFHFRSLVHPRTTLFVGLRPYFFGLSWFLKACYFIFL